MNKPLFKAGPFLLAAAIILPASFKDVYADAMMNGRMSVEILSPITLSEFQPMNFGAISPGLGTVTMSAGGMLSSTGSVSIMSEADASEARIRLVGAANTNIVLSMVEDSFTLASSTPGAPPIMAKNFKINGIGPQTALQLENSAAHFIPVGATLYIEDHPAGSYSGVYEITAHYE